MSTEIEAKFLVTGPGMSDRIRTLTRIGSYTLLEGTTKVVADVYMDTADGALLAAGYVCRCREQNGARLVTVKSTAPSAGAVYHREELEVAIGGGFPPDAWPASEAKERVLAIVGAKPLGQMFSLTQSRFVRRVADGQRHVADCSLDDVRIGEDTAQHRWQELEVELTADGTEADLVLMSGWLQENLGLHPSIASKFERAFEVFSGEPGLTPAGQRGAGRRTALQRPMERVIILEDATEGAGGFPSSALTAALPVMGYSVKERRRREDTLSFFDTHDGAFLKRGLTVVFSRLSGTWRLCEGDEVKTEHRTRPSAPPRGGALVGAAPTVAYLDADLVESEYQVGGLSAHLLRLRAQQWAFRIPLEESAPRHHHRLVVTGPATGSEYFASLLRSRLGWRTSLGPLVERGLALLGAVRPGTPMPGRFRVNHDDTVRQACARILQGEAWKMRANLHGAIHDLDAEFVHDLRVATRRARSALRLFSRMLDPESGRPLLEELAWIAAALGAVRDVDVLLARLRGQLGIAAASPDFGDIVGNRLLDRRARTLSVLVDALRSERFSDLLGRLEQSLTPPAASSAEADEVSPGDQPVRRFARSLIDKAFVKLATWTGRPADGLADTELHRIRILFKRLRYMCEFFRPLLGEDAGDLIDSFVGFQDCLGLHQDAATALRMLTGVLAEVPSALRSEEFLLSAGALLQVQRDIQLAQRERFVRRWRSAPRLIDLWKDLRAALGEMA